MHVIKKKFSTLFDREIPAIKAEIAKVKEDEELTDYEWHLKLHTLYNELYCAFIKNNKYDKEEAEGICNASAEHKASAEVVKQKEKDTRDIEAFIKARSDDPNFENEEELIPEYEQLIELNPQNKEYKTKLKKLEKRKLRIELVQQINQLQCETNKKGLIIVYRSLMSTYKNPGKQECYQSKINSLEQELAEETKIHEQELQRAACYISLSDQIIAIGNNKKLSELSRKSQLASLLLERAKLGNEIKCYVKQAQEDARKGREFGYVAITLARQEKNQELIQKMQALVLQ